MLILTVRGPLGPAVLHRIDRDRVTIGRSPESDIVVHDASLSRLHAEIHREGGGWVVADRGSRNGTLLNRVPVHGSLPLAAGDEVSLGSTVIVFGRALAGAIEAQAVSGTVPLAWSERGSGEESAVLIGASAATSRVLAEVERAAASTRAVLVTGESGTGKELVARLVHQRSPRRAERFVVVNCPALPGSLFEAELFGVEKGVATGVEARPGRIESARAGTLFLDEVGDLDPAAQAKILRFLQEKTFERVGGRKEIRIDVRVVAATNHDLEADVAASRFRLDLFHRLNFFRITLAPLRERREDLEPLALHFLARSARPGVRLAAETLACLARHDWPGNVRELEYVIERAALAAPAGDIRPEDLPEPLGPGAGDRPAGAATPAPAAALTAPSPRGEEETATAPLVAEILEGRTSFWDAVRRRYLDRSLSREEARRIVAALRAGSGGSYRELADRLGLDASGYKKLLNFINHHDLGAD